MINKLYWLLLDPPWKINSEPNIDMCSIMHLHHSLSFRKLNLHYSLLLREISHSHIGSTYGNLNIWPSALITQSFFFQKLQMWKETQSIFINHPKLGQRAHFSGVASLVRSTSLARSHYMINRSYELLLRHSMKRPIWNPKQIHSCVQ